MRYCRNQRVGEQIEYRREAGDRDDLVGAEPNAPDLALRMPRDEPRPERWPTGAPTLGQQAPLGIEDALVEVGL